MESVIQNRTRPPLPPLPTSTVLDLSLTDVQGGQPVALFPVVVAGEFVTLQALLAVVLDAGGSTASALAVEDL